MVADRIKKHFRRVKFIKTDNPDDIFLCRGDVIIVDAVRGIKKTTLLAIEDLKRRRLYTLHDFDLSFFLTLMKEMKKISSIRIIGIPMKINKAVVEEVRELLHKLTK